VTGAGNPIGNKFNIMTVDRRGPLVVQDTVFIDEMAHFDREVIPERRVHAKGAGAHGYFEVTDDITQYTKANLFGEIGKRTPIFVRFSTTGGSAGSADTVRDVRGFAVKFYTEEGIWDITGNNTPTFFIRDPINFPSMVHAAGKYNPATGLRDANTQWDFWSLRPEVTHQVMLLFTPRGIPNGYRYMHGFGSHTFKLVNAQGEAFYCKFHYLTDQGIQNLSVEDAAFLAGINPDYAIGDLYDAIARGDYPSWTFYIQIMTFAQAETWKFNPFDITKVWPQGEFPLIRVGRFTLDRNPSNFFAEVEQVAFSPSNMPPGIEPSPDKILHGRFFSYPDTQRHRLGANHLQIPINRPTNPVTNYQRDGPMTVDGNQGGAPNYYPNTFGGPEQDAQFVESTYRVTVPEVSRFNSADDDNFTQPQALWDNVLTQEEKEYMALNLAASMSPAEARIQNTALGNFEQVSPELAQMIRENLATFKKNKGAPNVPGTHYYF